MVMTTKSKFDCSARSMIIIIQEDDVRFFVIPGNKSELRKK